jgi:hypothetical protein
MTSAATVSVTPAADVDADAWPVAPATLDIAAMAMTAVTVAAARGLLDERCFGSLHAINAVHRRCGRRQS